MVSNTSQTLVHMTNAMNQHNNKINAQFDSSGIKGGLTMLLEAEECYEEAAGASEETQSQKQINEAKKSFERLRGTIEGCLKKRGWKWEEFEEMARRMLEKNEVEGLAYRLTPEGSMNLDTEEMKT